METPRARKSRHRNVEDHIAEDIGRREGRRQPRARLPLHQHRDQCGRPGGERYRIHPPVVEYDGLVDTMRGTPHVRVPPPGSYRVEPEDKDREPGDEIQREYSERLHSDYLPK